MARVVLDSSAVLAVLQFEAGAEVVMDFLKESAISAVNLTEVATKLVENGHSIADARRTIGMLGMDVEAVDENQAYAAAALRMETKAKGLSVGDRHCLALGAKLGVTVLTADKNWKLVKTGIDVKLIR
ncbi:MAG: type II toxin-antitoxin system VapC family toxin [Hyphomicrobiaceae bacterium]